MRAISAASKGSSWDISAGASYPFWALTLVAIDVLVIYGLAA